MRPFYADLTVDGRSERIRSALQVSVANGPSFGGGMRIDRDRRIDDGKLSMCVIAATSPWRLISLVPLLWFGRARWAEAAEVREGREMTLATSRPLEVSADGEIAGTTPVRFRVEPGALRVFADEVAPA
jgi:diacylglycerol kinase (ATP)